MFHNAKFELNVTGTFGFLLKAKKQSGNKTPNYIISLDKVNLVKSSPGYVGKVMYSDSDQILWVPDIMYLILGKIQIKQKQKI